MQTKHKKKNNTNQLSAYCLNMLITTQTAINLLFSITLITKNITQLKQFDNKLILLRVLNPNTLITKWIYINPNTKTIFYDIREKCTANPLKYHLFLKKIKTILLKNKNERCFANIW